MAKKNNELEYESRETLDAELSAAISDIASAEEQAKVIIAEAEESAKAVRMDGAVREREAREAAGLRIKAERDKQIADAVDRAARDRKERVANAEKEGEALVASKRKQVEKCVLDLYGELVGDK